MIDFELITHCWCYTRLLNYQLSSFVLYPPKSSCKLTVFACAKDKPTVELLEYFADLPEWPATVELYPWWLKHRQIKRRAIGRNLAALGTDARIVWFADCDMLFGHGCIDTLVDTYPPTESLCFPKIAMKSTYEDGAAYVEAAAEPKVLDVDWGKLVPTKQNRAIGGVQIVQGDTARRRGYLPEHKRYQTGATKWKRTYEDAVYRRYLAAGPGHPLQLPNSGRIRHEQCGRFVPGLRI